MSHIRVLDQVTIDKIAAGEVIERPASIVKELVENAIDAGATSVTVEIEDGGISMVRVTDNGSGIFREDIRNAFLRHSTSKIQCVEDLMRIASLGFRGEALSSIAAVTKAELVTKRREEPLGSRYVIEGGKELSLEDAGASDGTVFVARQLFYNVPARRKFLRTAMTESGHVQDLLMRLALSHPEVAVRFLNNGREKLRTSGSGKRKEVIYNVYGREVAAGLLEVAFEKSGIRMDGYIGKPMITRGNRNFETFFVNGRYVKSSIISKALEDAYKDFTMQHKFPFAVLAFSIDGEQVDINVHPTKMELRFQKQQDVYQTVYEGIHRRLLEPELIPQVPVPDPIQAGGEYTVVPAEKEAESGISKAAEGKAESGISKAPEGETGSQDAKETEGKEPVSSPFLLKPHDTVLPETRDEEYFIRKMRERVLAYHDRSSSAEVADRQEVFRRDSPGQKGRIRDAVRNAARQENAGTRGGNMLRETGTYQTKEPDIQARQLDLFEEKLLKRETLADYKLIGQVFDTYWLVQFQDNLYIIDQHAAHERVLYERILKGMEKREYTSQYISPPIILPLSMQEARILNEHMERFEKIGFEIEPFGGEEYAVRAVPGNLFGIAKKELLLEMLDSLADGVNSSMTPRSIDEKIASLSCKAAVKGNQRLSAQEVDALIKELLRLENPYHCPHGRPTIIAMSKRELEKKFKRIV